MHNSPIKNKNNSPRSISNNIKPIKKTPNTCLIRSSSQPNLNEINLPQIKLDKQRSYKVKSSHYIPPIKEFRVHKDLMDLYGHDKSYLKQINEFKNSKSKMSLEQYQDNLVFIIRNS